MSSRDFNEELGYSVLNPGIVLGTEFAPPPVHCVRAEAGFVAIFNLRYNTQKVLQNDRKATPNRSVHFFGLKIQI